jgi:preprotein translocase subunit SecF
MAVIAARTRIDRGRFKTAIMTWKTVSGSSVATMRLYKIMVLFIYFIYFVYLYFLFQLKFNNYKILCNMYHDLFVFLLCFFVFMCYY